MTAITDANTFIDQNLINVPYQGVPATTLNACLKTITNVFNSYATIASVNSLFGYALDGNFPAALMNAPNQAFTLNGGYVSISALLLFSSGQKYTVGPDGNYVLNAANGPAWDWSTGRRRLLIEAIPTTNLITWSQDLTYWGSGGTTTIASVASTAPDGAANSQKIIPAAVSGSSFYRQASAYALTANTNYVKWGIFKPDGYNIVVGQSRKLDGTWLYAHFNIATGAVTNISAGVTAWTVLLKGGWYLVAMSFNSGTGATAQNDTWYVSNAAGFPTFTPDGTSGVLHWHSQCEVGTTPSSPIVSGASATARAGDIVTAASGLLALFKATNAALVLRGSVLDAGTSWASILGGNAGGGISTGMSAYTGATFYDAGTVHPLAVTGGVATSLAAFGIGVSYTDVLRKACVTGGSIFSDNYGLFPPSETGVVFGSGPSGARNIMLDEIIVWPILASDAGLQAQARVYS